VKVGDMVGSPYHLVHGIVVEAESDEKYNTGPAVRVKWFDGDESFEWAKVLTVISESR